MEKGRRGVMGKRTRGGEVRGERGEKGAGECSGKRNMPRVGLFHRVITIQTTEAQHH